MWLGSRQSARRRPSAGSFRPAAPAVPVAAPVRTAVQAAVRANGRSPWAWVVSGPMRADGLGVAVGGAVSGDSDLCIERVSRSTLAHPGQRTKTRKEFRFGGARCPVGVRFCGSSGSLGRGARRGFRFRGELRFVGARRPHGVVFPGQLQFRWQRCRRWSHSARSCAGFWFCGGVLGPGSDSR